MAGPVDRGADFGDAARHPGRGFVVDDANRLDPVAAVGRELFFNQSRVDAMPPIARHKVDFEPEPPGSHPLYSHPDVVLTPHLMGLSRRATAATFSAAAQGILDVLGGREPRAVVNPAWRTRGQASTKEIHA